MVIEDQRKNFDQIAIAIQDKLDYPESQRFHKRFKAFKFEEKIRCISGRVNVKMPGSINNGWFGREVCNVAKTYTNRRYLNGELWNYNTEGIFDKRSNNTYVVKDHPEANLVQQPIDRASSNIIDCSTFVGMILRGIKYEDSPYAKSPSIWTPSNGTSGIRALTNNSTKSWKNNLFDYQPLDKYSDIGHTDYGTIRTAADIGNLYSYLGDVIYDSIRDGDLQPSNGNFHTCTDITVPGRGSLFNLLQPGDLIFLSNMAWYSDTKAKTPLSKLGLRIKTGIPKPDDVIRISFINGDVSFTCSNSELEFYTWNKSISGTTINKKIDAEIFKSYVNDVEGYYEYTANWSQPRRFRNISHIGISAENPQYMYEVTTLEKTFYYRDLLPTSDRVMPRFSGISYIVRPQYGSTKNVTYTIPLNENILKFPWTYSRISDDEYTVKDEHGAIISTGRDNNGLRFKMMPEDGDYSQIGIWGTSTNGVYNTLIGSVDPNYPYNKIVLTPGTYAIRLIGGNDNVKLQVTKAGSVDDMIKNNIVSSDGEITFNITQNIDAAVRIAVDSSGKTFGSGSSSSKVYTTLKFYLKKIS